MTWVLPMRTISVWLLRRCIRTAHSMVVCWTRYKLIRVWHGSYSYYVPQFREDGAAGAVRGHLPQPRLSHVNAVRERHRRRDRLYPVQAWSSPSEGVGVQDGIFC